jgi:aromatic ring hydroxylase
VVFAVFGYFFFTRYAELRIAFWSDTTQEEIMEIFEEYDDYYITYSDENEEGLKMYEVLIPWRRVFFQRKDLKENPKVFRIVTMFVPLIY